MKFIASLISLVAAIDDRFHSIETIITENGFEFEQHEVTTLDGYILTLHRIPGNGSPILLQHGIEDSTMEWIINSEDKALAFMLSRKGHDIWMGNNRGNTYSMRHVNFTSNQKEFWDFDQE
jgi:lysosomal acid lipase/cholesteryl ester hydrolase